MRQARMLSVLILCLSLFGPLTAQGQKRAVVMITVDTLRADRVGRQPESITPSIDALARDGVLFSRAMAQVPITLPSHISILTGSYPIHHGVRDFGGIALKKERELLSEILKAAGYRTAAFVSSFALDSTWGLDQGFDSYHDRFDLSGYQGIGFNAVERRGDQTVDLALQWLAKQADPNYFLWVHLFDPHDPYTPPAPYKKRFSKNPYDGEVAFADAQIGRLLEALKAAGHYREALIVLMGDHGEGLGEHGEETHGFFVYNSTLHIPLIIKLPANQSAGKKISRVVQSIDVAPTVMQILRFPRGSQMQGKGLLGLVRSNRSGSSPAIGESLYARYHFGWSSLLSYQDERYKYIRAPRKEIYDLKEDPAERRNLYQTQSALAEQYDSLLDQVIGRFSAASEEEQDQKHDEMDAETRQRLQSLGYITTSGGRNTDPDDLNRADPKDKIDLFSKVRRATIATEMGRIAESVRLLSEVVREDPAIYSARYLQGFNFFQGSKFMLAVNEFKEALKLYPESPDAVHSLAQSYSGLGLFKEARAGYELLSRLEPENPRASVGLGQIDLSDRKFPDAEAHFQRALDLGNELQGRLGLGRVLVAQKKFGQGLEQLNTALRLSPGHAQTHLFLYLAYKEEGTPEKAEEHLRKFKSLSGRPK